MKFSIASIISLAPLVAGGNLRAPAPATEGVRTEGRFSFAGLDHLPTSAELAVIDQAVMEAYNKVFYKHQLSMAAPHSNGVVQQDDGSAMIMLDYLTQGGGGYCQYCGPDDVDDWGCYIDPNCGRMETLTETQLTNLEQATFHAKFTKSACKMIRKSGVESLAQVKDCSFAMLENPGSFNSRFSEENTYESMEGVSADVEIALYGLTKELSKEDLKVLESAVFNAHNAAFYQTQYSLTSMDAISSLVAGGETVINARAIPAVSDDKLTAADSLAPIHEAFEEAFCGKLQKSGRAVFDEVHDCAFRFIVNPVKELNTKKVAATVA